MTTTEKPRRRKAPWPIEFYRSDVGKKWVMALSGIALLAYVLVHMLGNLHLYEGFDEAAGVFAIDEYGEFLRDILEPIFPRTVFLWILRVGLTLAFVIHIHAAYSLWLKNKRARPEDYESRRDYVTAKFASRTMVLSGSVILAFLIWHLADLTWGVPVVNGEFERGEVYANVVASFSRPLVSIWYIIANLLLGLHIYHGAWSLFQSLGINNPRYNHWRRSFAVAFAALIVVGNVSFPVAVLTGIVS